MALGSNDGSAGRQLRFMRLARGLTIRAVDEYSRSVVQATGNPEFLISHSTLINIVMHGQVPGLYKLHTISVIYCVSLAELLAFYGLSLDVRNEMQDRIQMPRTHLVSAGNYDSRVPADVPPGPNQETSFQDTQVLTNQARAALAMTQGLPQTSELQGRLLGYIGLEDYTMFPLVRPGTLVQVDTGESRVRSGVWRHELERPIYFLELRRGYAFGWCEIAGRHLRIVPHPFSGPPIRSLPFPDQVDVLGRVSALTMSLGPREVRAAPPLSAPSPLVYGEVSCG